MSHKTIDKKIEGELADMLAEEMPGVSVVVEVSARWHRPCATFVWDGFKDLLPEERFQRLTRVIPESFRESRMAGYVWLELVDGESIDDFLAHPRSEDIESRERDIYRQLRQGGFFDLLAKSLGRAPDRNCPGDFTQTEQVIEQSNSINVTTADARLVFIRHGVYCDCQVLQGAEPALAELYAGAA